MALGDVVARLAVHLNLDTAAFEKGTGKAKREVSVESAGSSGSSSWSSLSNEY